MGRLLIGNDTDPGLIANEDVRSWTQRVLWFAQSGDSIVLMSPPDQVFLTQVANVTGVDVTSLSFHVVPEAPSGKHIFDCQMLTEETFLKSVSENSTRVDLTQIIPLWPSQHVAHFATELGLAKLQPGHKFLSQNGGAVCNSKAIFRALAAQAGVSLPRGVVCTSPTQALKATRRLLKDCEAVLVKKSYGGGGGGNQLLSTSPDITADMAGAAFECRIEGSGHSIERYWESHWNWASVYNRHPVVIEEFIPEAESVYAEFECTNGGVSTPQLGSLKYGGGQLIAELTPNTGLGLRARDILVANATRVAEVYHRIGYRGFLSADAVVTVDHRVYFTEVNAQFTTSTHLYKAIQKAATGSEITSEYSAMQFAFPEAVESLSTLLEKVDDLKVGFDKGRKEGIVPAWPVVQTANGGRLYLCAVAKDANRVEELVNTLLEGSGGRGANASKGKSRRRSVRR